MAGTGYVEIMGWDRWQSYRTDRGAPPWIKVHRNLMSNPDWALLSDAEKGQLVSMWIVAADKNGRLPSDERIIKKICGLDDAPNLRRFKELGFIDVKLASVRRHVDAPETETETETEKKRHTVFDVEARFEEVWARYPNKAGKKEALKHFRATVKDEEALERINRALDVYIQTDNVLRGYVKNGSTWFNNWEDYVDYTEPAKVRGQTAFQPSLDTGWMKGAR